ncbi:MAG TPA: acyltransferase [Candidatus Atribacteria bacterium]|nr:acyltransferase [Candidatus Atribacteria bacterium]
MRKILLNIAFYVYSKFKNREDQFKAKYYKNRLISKLELDASKYEIKGKIKATDYSGLILGKHLVFGDNVFFESRGGVIIGDSTFLGSNVSIYSASPYYEGSELNHDQKFILKPVYIGKNVRIGNNVIIHPGVSIGNSVQIADGCVVVKDVEAGGVISLSQQPDMASQFQKIEKRNPNLTENTSGGKDKKEKNRVFVFSTGRSGSAAIVDYLNQTEEVSAFHEAFYVILKVLSLQYLTGKISKAEVKAELDILLNNYAVGENKVLVHSDQKLVPFITILRELYPEAKYIWLIRHPKSFLKSVVSRGWFKNDDPIPFKNSYLLNLQHRSQGLRVNGVMVQKFSQKEWSEMDVFQRNLWYWKYWNQLIEDQFINIPSERKFILKLENFDNSLQELHNFLKLESKPKQPVRSNRVKKRDKARYEELNKKINKEFVRHREMIDPVREKWGY